MSLGYDVSEEERDYSISGVTGDITRYMVEQMEFPCIVIDMREHIPSQTKLNLLATLFSAPVPEENARQPVTVSALIMLKSGDEMQPKYQKLGRIQPRQVKSLMKMLNTGSTAYDVTAFLNKSTELKGEMVFALAE